MIFSVLAFVTLVISVSIKTRGKSLFVQAMSCLFESIYDFLIYAYTGAVLSFLNFIRTCLFINKNKFNKYIYFSFLVIFEMIILLNCVFTWEGYISIFPTVASVIRTYALWQSRMNLVRISGITTGSLYGIYYIYHNSPFMIFGELFLLVVSCYALYKNDYKDKI